MRRDPAQILRDADELASNAWRIPDDERPAYMRVVQRLLSRITGVVVALVLAMPLGAQGTKPDTLLQRQVRQWLDTIARDKSAPKYSKKAQAKIDTLTRAHLKPPIVIPPPDTVKPPPDTVIVPPPDTVTPPPDTTTAFAAPELPRSVPEFQIAAPTRIVTVPRPGVIRSILSIITAGAVEKPDLQTALDEAQPGDEIRLANGARYAGNFTFSSCLNGWVTITTEGAAVPQSGTRVTPTWAAANQFAKISSENHEPAFRTVGPACKVRFVGVEIVGEWETFESLAYGVIRFGQGGDDGQTSIERVPRDFLLDRVYIHGLPNHNNTRCVVLNSGAAIVRDSWISDCHARGSDSQAILGWNGPGPYLIENNYLEGAGENVMFGGADPGIFGLIPCDITVRSNHVAKPLTWRNAQWSIKNLFELKNACRVLVENNVFERSWPASQEGMAIVIKSSQDNCGTCLWQGTTDLSFRWNIVRDAAVGLNLQAVDGSGQVAVTNHVKRVRVEQNLFERIGAEGRAALMMFTHDLMDVVVVDNTFLHDAKAMYVSILLAYSEGARRLAWQRNIMTAPGGYPVYTESGLHYAGLQAATANTSIFELNTVVGGAEFAHAYPTSNLFPATIPTSPTNGVNMAELLRRTAGVVVAP